MDFFNPNDPNLASLEQVAAALGPELCDELVIVGGVAAGLLITDLALPAIRRTLDVDVLTPAQALTEHHQFEERLRQRGFIQDPSADAPVCRWLIEDIPVDLLPTRVEVLGFTNRWYELGAQTADSRVLPSGQRIRVMRAPEFIASKLEAFHGRGQGDYLYSHDIEDIISVMDGRDTLLEEVMASDASLRDYLSAEFTRLLTDPRFRDALPGHLPPDEASQDRLPDLMKKLQRISDSRY